MTLTTNEEWEIRCRQLQQANQALAEFNETMMRCAARWQERATRAEAHTKSPVAPSGGGRPRGTSGAGEPAPLVDDQVVAGVWAVVLAAGVLMFIGAVTLIGWVTTLVAGVIA